MSLVGCLINYLHFFIRFRKCGIENSLCLEGYWFTLYLLIHFSIQLCGTVMSNPESSHSIFLSFSALHSSPQIICNDSNTFALGAENIGLYFENMLNTGTAFHHCRRNFLLFLRSGDSARSRHKAFRVIFYLNRIWLGR